MRLSGEKFLLLSSKTGHPPEPERETCRRLLPAHRFAGRGVWVGRLGSAARRLPRCSSSALTEVTAQRSPARAPASARPSEAASNEGAARRVHHVSVSMTLDSISYGASRALGPFLILSSMTGELVYQGKLTEAAACAAPAVRLTGDTFRKVSPTWRPAATSAILCPDWGNEKRPPGAIRGRFASILIVKERRMRWERWK